MFSCSGVADVLSTMRWLTRPPDVGAPVPSVVEEADAPRPSPDSAAVEGNVSQGQSGEPAGRGRPYVANPFDCHRSHTDRRCVDSRRAHAPGVGPILQDRIRFSRPSGRCAVRTGDAGFFNASRSEVRVRLALYSRATGGRIAVVDASVPPGSQAFLDSPIIGFEGDAIAGTVSVVSATGSAGGSVGSISLQVMDTQTGKYVCCHVAGDIDFD
jgi:hypothetical protein